ncbi:MAG: hypothetical protein ACRELU_06720 [Gemmatimonadota bacterium]
MTKILGSVLFSLSTLVATQTISAQEERLGPVPRTWSGGSEDLETEPFPIASGPWRIDWDTEHAAPGSYLLITVRHETGTAVETFTHQGEGSGSDRIDTRAGVYYLEITGVDLEWTVSMSERIAATQAGPPTLPVQACTGRGTVGGQGFVEAGVGFGNDARVYSMGGGYDSRGPVTVNFAANFVDNDDVEFLEESFESPDAYGGSGGILIQVTEQPVNVCPAFTVGYSRLEELEVLEDLGVDVDLDLWSASAGVAFGLAVPAGDSGIFVMPFAAPSLLLLHGRGSVEFEGGLEEESDTEIEFGARGGLFFGGSRLYGGISVTATTIEDDDPTFGLGFGVAF